MELRRPQKQPHMYNLCDLFIEIEDIFLLLRGAGRNISPAG